MLQLNYELMKKVEEYEAKIEELKMQLKVAAKKDEGNFEEF